MVHTKDLRRDGIRLEIDNQAQTFLYVFAKEGSQGRASNNRNSDERGGSANRHGQGEPAIRFQTTPIAKTEEFGLRLPTH